jgi:hypothetical protein
MTLLPLSSIVVLAGLFQLGPRTQMYEFTFTNEYLTNPKSLSITLSTSEIQLVLSMAFNAD